MMAVLERPRTAADLARVVGGVLHGTPGETPVRGLADDSRAVTPGAAFFARPGAGGDGGRHAPAAQEAGASVVVAERPLAGVGAWIEVSDAAAALRAAADAWYGAPQDALRLVGVTGTKGKTTVAQLLGAALRGAGHPTATLGTVEHDLGDGHPVPARNTTPGALELRRLLARARDAGTTHAVLEVSSHALDQRRTAGLDFAVAVFTNLGRDHLDYHPSPAAYLDAKARLFEGLAPGATAVLPHGDPVFARLAGATRARVLTYGEAPGADLVAVDVRLGAEGTAFALTGGAGAAVPVHTPLIGRHNVRNLLAAVAAAVALDVPLATAAAGAAGLAGVRGRLERVPGGEAPRVFVDYAHTPEALEAVLACLREVGGGPLACVVGCGGGRDRGKRPLMARVALARSDQAVFTSDNPRGEDPAAILEDMLAGLTAAERARVWVEPDRRAAIRAAVLGAPATGCVLIAGKGHETCQIVGERRLPFDDLQEARAALDLRRGGSWTARRAWGTPRGR